MIVVYYECWILFFIWSYIQVNGGLIFDSGRHSLTVSTVCPSQQLSTRKFSVVMVVSCAHVYSDSIICVRVWHIEFNLLSSLKFDSTRTPSWRWQTRATQNDAKIAPIWRVSFHFTEFHFAKLPMHSFTRYVQSGSSLYCYTQFEILCLPIIKFLV